MDTHDSPRSSLPARQALQRPLVPSTIRNTGGLPEVASVSPISVRVAIRGVRRYWWLILTLWVVGSAGVMAGVWYKVKPNFRAASYLQVQAATDDLFGVRGHGEAMDTFLNTQVQLIESSNVLSAAGVNPKAVVLDRIQKADDVILELKGAIEVGVVPGTLLIEVAMTSTSAFEAAVLVNSVVEAFMASNAEWANGVTKEKIATLETYMGDLKQQSDAVESRWRTLAGKGNADPQIVVREKPTDAPSRPDELANKRTITLDMYKDVQRKHFDVTLELAEANGLLAGMTESIENARNSPKPDVDNALVSEQVEALFKDDPDVIALAQQMMEARERRDSVGQMARIPGDPAERKAHEKLQQLEARYNRLWEVKGREIRAKVLAEAGSGADGLFADAARDLRAVALKVFNLKNKQAILQGQIDQLEVKSKNQASDEVDIALVLDQRESLKAMKEQVNRRIEQLKFEQKGEARISLVDVAKPPGQPISNNRLKYLAMTPVGILGTVLGLILLLEIRSARVADPDALSSRIRQEVFAIAPLPEIRAGEDGNDEKSEQRLARFVQSLDHLRVALCEGGLAGEGRCVMITSATGGEGKTTLAAHLAARCANARTSTLLIDADMRRASLGRLLDVPPGPGLADVLAGDVSFEDATITVQAGGFHFLSAGISGRDPSRVLKSARLSELLGRLRQQYDLVIIDTPPVLPVADALIIGRWADGAVMAARFDASRMPLVERANRQLATAGIPVLGVVVNGVKGQHAAYGNYAYSYNYTGPADRSTPAVPV